jgi:hypothetical protein
MRAGCTRASRPSLSKSARLGASRSPGNINAQQALQLSPHARSAALYGIHPVLYQTITLVALEFELDVRLFFFALRTQVRRRVVERPKVRV